MLTPALSGLLIAAHLLARLHGAHAVPNSTVVCDPNYKWAFNSLNQSPCSVAAFMEGACTDGVFSISPLPLDSHYVGPNLNNVNGCRCSSVVYSLVSACGDCQDSEYITWPEWNTNCSASQISLKSFPLPIPDGTRVPGWAYLDVSTEGMYDPVLAQADHSPERGPPHSKKSSNAGAIAGGVVGGLLGLALIVGLVVFFCLRRKKAETAPSAAYSDVKPHAMAPSMSSAMPSQMSPSMSSTMPSPMSPPVSQYPSEYGHQGLMTPSSPYTPNTAMSQKAYDPSDPSTFPTPAPTPTIYTTNPPTSGYYDQSRGGLPRPPPGAAYSGVPEL